MPRRDLHGPAAVRSGFSVVEEGGDARQRAAADRVERVLCAVDLEHPADQRLERHGA
jgi:hypothetical protein